MPDRTPVPGDLIAGKYRVEGVLGAGGMGTVYAVSHRDTGKRLALKCLLPGYVDNPNIVERFLREAKAVGRIQHRHVIDVFDQGRDGSVLFIVLPLLEGKSLADLLHDDKLTLEEALLIMIRAMEGVAAANALGVLHRDLKPSNIFVCEGVSGRLDDPRVLDFGISKLDGDVDLPLTRSGVAVGTPYYMSIEQLTGQRDVDARVDVYSMGVILYEAMSGVLPHVAENMAALALRLMHTPPCHLRLHRPDLPVGLCDVVMRAISRDRDARYANMRELIQALLPYVGENAALTVREPIGTRLRTPKDASEPDVANEMAALAATTKAAQGGSARVAASHPPVGSAQPSLPPSRARFSRLAILVASTGLVGLGIAWLAPQDSTPLPSGATARSVETGHLDAPAQKEEEAVTNGKAGALPAVQPISDASLFGGNAMDTPSDASSEPSGRTTRRNARRTARAEQTPERGLEPTVTSLPEPPSGEGVRTEPESRAGSLKTDEF